jgi:hypothetical protein
MTETKGVVLFAYNTPEIDYIKLAVLAAKYAKHAMHGYEVSLITNNSSWEYAKIQEYFGRAESTFDQIIFTDPQFEKNRRVHYDSPYHKFVSNFQNANKHEVINYTPYDRTLMIDIDYILQNNELEYAFDSDQSVILYHEAESLVGYDPAPPQQYLDELGIPMLWSTVIYFNRNDPEAQMFFDLWAHVAANYDFYQFLYAFPPEMYRTDFCVSIASHIMNGMRQGPVIGDFPSKMINMSQRDDIVKINAVDDWIYIVNDMREHWKNSLTRITRENVHVMNKRSLERNFDDIIALLDGESV